MTVSVIGLGLMGRPMAECLARQGWDVLGWNRSPLPEPPAGVTMCEHVEQAAVADLVILMLVDTPTVDSMLAAIEPTLTPGQTVVDMGSSNPEHSKAHARRLAARGIGWVDAPVSGGPEGAAAGELAIMVGGEPECIAAAAPVFEGLGRNAVTMGGPGAGHTAKVVNQIIVCLTIQAVAEAFALGEACGLDLETVQSALHGGSADSLILQIQGSRMIRRDYAPGGRVTTVRKDLTLAMELAAERGLELPHVVSTVAMSNELVEDGFGALDASALHKRCAPEPPVKVSA